MLQVEVSAKSHASEGLWKMYVEISWIVGEVFILNEQNFTEEIMDER